MVQSHLQIVLGNNRVASKFSSDTLLKTVQGDAEGLELSELLERQCCDHKRDLSGTCLGKYREGRSKNFAIYKTATCAHGSTRNGKIGTCSTKIDLGFTINGINDLVSGVSTTIPLVIKVTGNCSHCKDFDYSLLCGE